MGPPIARRTKLHAVRTATSNLRKARKANAYYPAVLSNKSSFLMEKHVRMTELTAKRLSSSSLSTASILSSISSMSSLSLGTINESNTEISDNRNQRWLVAECGGQDKPIRVPPRRQLSQKGIVGECDRQDKPIRVPLRRQFSQKGICLVGECGGRDKPIRVPLRRQLSQKGIYCTKKSIVTKRSIIFECF